MAKVYIVRSKGVDINGNNWYLSDLLNEYAYPPYTKVKKGAIKFATKEDAEQFNNPKTEIIEVEI